MTAALLSQPDWHAAAQALVSGCVDLRQGDEAISLMEAVCRSLGSELYPAFLRVLHEVGRHGDHAARLCVAETLARGLTTGRLPSGRRGAFGGHGQAQGGWQRGRQLGPLEFLCTALEQQGQPDGPLPLPQADLITLTASVIDLVSTSDTAMQLYSARLLAEAADPLEGAYSRTARHALHAMATLWRDGGSPDAVGASLVQALRAARPQSLGERLGMRA